MFTIQTLFLLSYIELVKHEAYKNANIYVVLWQQNRAKHTHTMQRVLLLKNISL